MSDSAWLSETVRDRLTEPVMDKYHETIDKFLIDKNIDETNIHEVNFVADDLTFLCGGLFRNGIKFGHVYVWFDGKMQIQVKAHN